MIKIAKDFLFHEHYFILYLYFDVNIILHVFVEWNRVQFMQHYLIKVVSDLQQVGGFLRGIR
jgi:hypothetical protein